MSWTSDLYAGLWNMVALLSAPLILVLCLIMPSRCNFEPDDTRFYHEPGEKPMYRDFLTEVFPGYDYKTDAKLKLLRVKYPTESGTVNKSFNGESIFPVADFLKTNIARERSDLPSYSSIALGKTTGRSIDLKFYDEYGGAQRLEIREREYGQADIIWRPDGSLRRLPRFVELLDVLGL